MIPELLLNLQHYRNILAVSLLSEFTIMREKDWKDMLHSLFTSKRNSTPSDQGVTLIIWCWETLRSQTLVWNAVNTDKQHWDFSLSVSLHLSVFIFRQTVSLCIIDGDFSVILSAG